MAYTNVVLNKEEYFMNQNSQTPPEFQKKKNSINPKYIAGAAAFVVAAGACGFGGAMLANNMTGPSGVTINQQSGNSSTAAINDVSDIAAKCGPSVVEITTQGVASSGGLLQQQYITQGAGSGVIMSEDGYIITNHHVIENATAVAVRTTDGQEYSAEIIGSDSQTDLAVLKINATGLSPATFGDSDSLEVGDAAIAIGNPLGELGGTVTTGIISALDRQITIDDTTMTLLQTDAAINPGNSGGGLFDASGNLIGIVNAKESSTGVEGLGFAIPINGAIDIINELIENGSVTSRPALNVSLYDYSGQSYYSQGNMEAGCYIVQVVEGGAADQAGLQVNDRIVKFDGQDITSSSEVKAILNEHKIGDTVTMVIERDGQQQEVNITLQSQSQQQ